MNLCKGNARGHSAVDADGSSGSKIAPSASVRSLASGARRAYAALRCAVLMAVFIQDGARQPAGNTCHRDRPIPLQ